MKIEPGSTQARLIEAILDRGNNATVHDVRRSLGCGSEQFEAALRGLQRERIVTLTLGYLSVREGVQIIDSAPAGEVEAMATEETKECSKCHQVKPLWSFPAHHRAKGGLGHECRACRSAGISEGLKRRHRNAQTEPIAEREPVVESEPRALPEPKIESGPVMISVPLEGFDIEARTLNAIVYLLEGRRTPEDQLTAEQKGRIAGYLAARYASVGRASPEQQRTRDDEPALPDEE